MSLGEAALPDWCYSTSPWRAAFKTRCAHGSMSDNCNGLEYFDELVCILPYTRFECE